MLDFLEMKSIINLILAVLLLTLASSPAFATDAAPLQDFCVAVDNKMAKNGVFVNGQFCKDPKLVNADDFAFSGLNIPGNTSNALGLGINLVNIEQLPGVNTQGVSIARLDFAPGGLNPPHLHPRASEIFLVVEGTLYAGFVTALPEYRLITKVLHKGDVFVFPVGLIHFQFNVGKTNVVAHVAFNSQNPGIIHAAEAIFGSNPPIHPDVIAKAFKLDKDVVEDLQSQFEGMTIRENCRNICSV